MGKGSTGSQTTTQTNTPWTGVQPYMSGLYGLGWDWLFGGNAPALPAATTGTTGMRQNPNIPAEKVVFPDNLDCRLRTVYQWLLNVSW